MIWAAAGLGLAVVIVILIWFLPGRGEPVTDPPPSDEAIARATLELAELEGRFRREWAEREARQEADLAFREIKATLRDKPDRLDP